MKEDEDREFKTMDKGYYLSSSVNYPNNSSLVKQNVYMDKDGKIEKVEVVDKEDKVQIMMNFKVIEYDKKFDKNYFELSSILDMNKTSNKIETKSNETKNDVNTKDEATNENIISNSESNSNDNTDVDSSSSVESKNETKPTASIDDVVYPMYLPDNTYLTSKETIETENGERLILTFGGDSSFILVEEVGKFNDSGLIIPVSGEFDFLSDVIGIINKNSLSWYSNGIEYYMVSDTLEVSEMIEIARSFSVLPVSK